MDIRARERERERNLREDMYIDFYQPSQLQFLHDSRCSVNSNNSKNN